MRLIDADEFPTKHVNIGDDAYGIGYDDGVQTMLDEINDAPTIDAIPVVRCKDCIFSLTNYYNDKGCKFDMWCRVLDTPTTSDWFCADGERRGGEQDG